MSRHRIILELDVDDEALGSAEWNGVGSARGPIVPVDVSEWSVEDLSFVLPRSVLLTSAEIVDYTAVLDPAEARAAAEADARARAEGAS